MGLLVLVNSSCGIYKPYRSSNICIYCCLDLHMYNTVFTFTVFLKVNFTVKYIEELIKIKSPGSIIIHLMLALRCQSLTWVELTRYLLGVNSSLWMAKFCQRTFRDGNYYLSSPFSFLFLKRFSLSCANMKTEITNSYPEHSGFAEQCLFRRPQYFQLRGRKINE